MRIAIVEDEQACADTLQKYLQQYGQEFSQELDVTQYENGAVFLREFRSQFDIILLDISMPVMDGMETARQIRKIDSDVVLLFVTSLSQYAIRGYEVDAMDYILKPVSYFAFSQRMNRAMARVKSHAKNYLIVSTKNGMQKLDISTIYYVESQGHTLILHTRSGDYPCAGTMKEIEQKLEEFHFFRCNKGYLVALQYVDGVQDGCAVVNGELLLISRARKNEFMDALTEFVGGKVI